MSVKTVRVSNLSNELIPPGTGARIRVMWTDENKVDLRADLTDAEALKLAKQFKAEEVETRPERRGETRVRA